MNSKNILSVFNGQTRLIAASILCMQLIVKVRKLICWPLIGGCYICTGREQLGVVGVLPPRPLFADAKYATIYPSTYQSLYCCLKVPCCGYLSAHKMVRVCGKCQEFWLVISRMQQTECSAMQVVEGVIAVCGAIIVSFFFVFCHQITHLLVNCNQLSFTSRTLNSYLWLWALARVRFIVPSLSTVLYLLNVWYQCASVHCCNVVSSLIGQDVHGI